MSTVHAWLVGLSVHEDDGLTRADAHLVLGEDTDLLGHGAARRNPADPDVTEIGERIAVARALSDLANLLLGTAAAELEDITHERTRLHM